MRVMEATIYPPNAYALVSNCLFRILLFSPNGVYVVFMMSVSLLVGIQYAHHNCEESLSYPFNHKMGHPILNESIYLGNSIKILIMSCTFYA